MELCNLERILQELAFKTVQLWVIRLLRIKQLEDVLKIVLMGLLVIGQQEFAIIILKIVHSVGEIIIIQVVQIYVQVQLLGILLEIILLIYAKQNALMVLLTIIQVVEHVLMYVQVLIMQMVYQQELIIHMEIMIQKGAFCIV
jgi:hypothetical protein